MKVDITQLGFFILNKSLEKSTEKEGSLNSPQEEASFCENITEFQEVSILDQKML